MFRRRMQRHVDRFTAIKCDGGKVLVEEWLEHDYFVPMVQEGSENRVLAYSVV